MLKEMCNFLLFKLVHVQVPWGQHEQRSVLENKERKKFQSLIKKLDSSCRTTSKLFKGFVCSPKIKLKKMFLTVSLISMTTCSFTWCWNLGFLCHWCKSACGWICGLKFGKLWWTEPLFRVFIVLFYICRNSAELLNLFTEEISQSVYEKYV